MVSVIRIVSSGVSRSSGFSMIGLGLRLICSVGIEAQWPAGVMSLNRTTSVSVALLEVGWQLCGEGTVLANMVTTIRTYSSRGMPWNILIQMATRWSIN